MFSLRQEMMGHLPKVQEKKIVYPIPASYKTSVYKPIFIWLKVSKSTLFFIQLQKTVIFQKQLFVIVVLLISTKVV